LPPTTAVGRKERDMAKCKRPCDHQPSGPFAGGGPESCLLSRWRSRSRPRQGLYERTRLRHGGGHRNPVPQPGGCHYNLSVWSSY